jgi:riboflavin biosynthesis pyrimidine reductase
MSVIATLVVGANGATSKDGSSRALSTPADRERFLQLHRSAGAYIVGSNSFLHESYSHSKSPIFLFTRKPSTVVNATSSQVIVTDVADGFSSAISSITTQYPSPVVVECGVSLMVPLIESGEIDYLEISISPVEGDAHFIDVDLLLSHFTIESDETVEGTRLLKCRYKGHASNS